MIVAAIVLAAVQQNAEELFRKFEEKVAKAKSVSVTFKLVSSEGRMVEPEENLKISGTIRFKPGDRMTFDVTVVEKSRVEKISGRSDGRTLKVSGKEEDRSSKGLSKFLSGAFVKSGFSLLQAIGGDKDGSPDPDTLFKPSDFKIAEGSRIEVKVVSYTLEIEGKKMAVSLWLDTEKLVPVQRRVTVEQMSFMEHYEKVSFDEIPDAEFEHK